MKKKIVLKILEKEEQKYFEEIGLDMEYNL